MSTVHDVASAAARSCSSDASSNSQLSRTSISVSAALSQLTDPTNAARVVAVSSQLASESLAMPEAETAPPNASRWL